MKAELAYKTTHIAVALHPDEAALLDKIRERLRRKGGVLVPDTQILRMGLRVLAKQAGVK